MLELLDTLKNEKQMLFRCGCPVPSLNEKIDTLQVRLGYFEKHPLKFTIQERVYDDNVSKDIQKARKEGVDAIIFTNVPCCMAYVLDFFWFTEEEVDNVFTVNGKPFKATKSNPFLWEIPPWVFSRRQRLHIHKHYDYPIEGMVVLNGKRDQKEINVRSQCLKTSDIRN